MSGSRSKQKGAQGERDLVRLLMSWGHVAFRQPQVKGAADVACITPRDVKVLIECKRSKKANVRAALRQVTEANGLPGDLRACYIKDDHSEPFWVLSNDTMRALLALAGEKTAQNDEPNS